MTAAFRPEKNHIGAIKSLQLLHSEYKQKAYLLFVGDGMLLEQCRGTAEKMNMSEFIKFAGPQSDVRPFIGPATCLPYVLQAWKHFQLQLSKQWLVVFRSLLTNIGGASEMISEGLNGFLCEPEVADIAQKWSKTLQFNFSAETIHDYASKNFSAEKMIGEYRKTLQLVEQE